MKLSRLILTLLLPLLLTPSAWAGEKLKIGVMLPMTGPAASYGQMAWRGIGLAREEKPTVLGREVELILLDNKSDKVESTNAATRLVKRDKVAAIIGALSSSTTMAAAPIAEEAGVPMISGWATNPMVTQGRKWIFRSCFIDPFQGGVAARFAYHNLKKRRAGMMIDISRDYSVGLGAFFEKAFKEAGGEVVSKVLYNEGDQEFSAQLSTLAQAKPDIIYLPGYLPQEPLIIRQAREMGLNQPFLSGDAAQADETVSIGGPAVEGLYLTTHFDEKGVTTPAGRNYTRVYRERFKKAPDAMGALGYDAYMVLMDAVTRAAKADPEAIREALARTGNYPGACGVMTMVEQSAVKPAVILKIEKGEFVYVTTVEP